MYDSDSAVAKMPTKLTASEEMAERLRKEATVAGERADGLEREARDLRAVQRAAERALETFSEDDPEQAPSGRFG